MNDLNRRLEILRAKSNSRKSNGRRYDDVSQDDITKNAEKLERDSQRVKARKQFKADLVSESLVCFNKYINA